MAANFTSFHGMFSCHISLLQSSHKKVVQWSSVSSSKLLHNTRLFGVLIGKVGGALPREEKR